AEVLRLEHLGFGLLNELVDVLDVGVLKAVRRTDGKLELFHRTIEVRVELLLALFLRLGNRFRLLFEVEEHGELVLHDLRAERNGVFRVNGTVGPHFKRQLVEVGTLTDARLRDRVIHAADRREEAVDLDPADRKVFSLVELGRTIAAAAGNRDLSADLTALADGRDVLIRVENLNLLGNDDVGSLDPARAG